MSRPPLPCRPILPECTASGKPCPCRPFQSRQKSCGKVLGRAVRRVHLYATTLPVCPQTNHITKTTEKTDDSRHDNCLVCRPCVDAGGLLGGHPTGCVQ